MITKTNHGAAIEIVPRFLEEFRTHEIVHNLNKAMRTSLMSRKGAINIQWNWINDVWICRRYRDGLLVEQVRASDTQNVAAWLDLNLPKIQ